MKINYDNENYCATCRIRYPKFTIYCKSCNRKVRTHPIRRSKKL